MRKNIKICAFFSLIVLSLNNHSFANEYYEEGNFERVDVAVNSFLDYEQPNIFDFSHLPEVLKEKVPAFSNGEEELNRSKRESGASTCAFLIEVYTGSRSNAGTDSDIYIKLNDQFKGYIDNYGDDFEAGQTDYFVFKRPCSSFNDRDSLSVYSNGKRAYSSWYLEYIKIMNLDNGEYAKYEFNRWY